MLPRQCNGCKRLVTLLVTLAAVAAGRVDAASDDCAAPEYRAFDFWVGEWEVTGADGQPAGRNRITSEQRGCVLVERWQSIRDGTGVSMTFYEPLARQWRQVWVSPGIEIDISGGLVAGSMVLEGTVVYLQDERGRGFRGTWTPLPDGRLRQFFEEADGDGGWAPWFEGFYRRVEAPASP